MFLGIEVLPILQVIGDSLDAIESRPSLADVDWDALKIARIRRAESLHRGARHC